jgi:ubiquinone/menaquinone biosynthesis C-methylase UbiE
MKQIISQEKISENRIKIAIMHHNPTSVPSDDIEAFDAIINAGIVKGMLADAGFDLILHGHRHVTNCTHERTLQRGEASQQGLFVVGTDSLGCNRNAPFLELSLWDTRTAHSSFPPALFSIRVAEFDGKRYKVEPEPFVEEAIHRPMSTAFGEMLRRLGRQVDQNRRASVLDHLRTILPHLQKLQTTLVDWGTESELWISKFHTQLSMYSKLWATDVQDRDSGIAPMFESYLREQYQARLSTRIKDRVLRYSGSTFGAIMKTGWRPDPLFWGDYTIEQRTSEETSELEIVRIIVRDRKGAERNYELEGLNFVHKFFAIPLFVINHKDLKDDEIEDFALGFDRTNRVLRSFEYDKALGKVVETDLDRGQQLEGRFRRLLAHQKLQTVDEFLNRGVMISDPRREREFAENYDKTRCASPMILQILGNALQPDASKAGLDVGCGTGNYTLPFVDKFGTVSGIDNSQAMLDVAKTKNKSDRVHWVHASILNSGFNDQSFDAVWSISALHYFKDSQLKYLLRQVFRLLRNGGVFVADTEFSEQQASLWLVKFFPSLHQRYANTCYPSQWFKDELRNAGFREVTLEHREYSSVEGDRFLRVGQHNPEIYLDHDVRAGIPAFVSMAAAERENGLARLRQAIRNGDIKQIINDYTEAATMPGDLGIIIARK